MVYNMSREYQQVIGLIVNLYDYVLFQDEKRRQADYIDEAIDVWDKLSGTTVSYPDFLNAYVNTKYKLWTTQRSMN